MASLAFSRLAVLVSTAALLGVNAQQSTYPATPLAQKRFSYPTGLPYRVDTDDNLVRGRQSGYNQCNSTTEGQNSLCQVSFLSHIDDFCLWAPIDKDSQVADTEGEMVAWCTKPGRGTRLIPAGALQGVQFMKTPDYVQVVGFIDQSLINIKTGDSGGEMDPHGADLRGNPLGGVVFSTAWSPNNDTYTQAVEWHNFMGGEQFCFKACDPAGPNAAKFCEHVYDRIGCLYNAPNAAQKGVFESCLGDNQDFPGIFTEDGQVKTYHQPAESLGAISTMPYQPKVPPSSSCTQFTSSVVFAALGTAAPTSSAGPSGPSAPSGASGKPTGAAGSGSKSGSGGAPAVTGTGGAEALGVGVVSGAVGVLFAALFLA